MTDQRKRVLILSFTDIANDARVKRQALQFADRYRVTTCGYGEPVRSDIEHVRLQPRANSGALYAVRGVAIRAHAYAAASRLDGRVHDAARALRGREFDAVIANEIETARLAFDLVGPERTHLDLHEYYPGLHDENPVWVRVRKPFEEWTLRKLATRAGSTSTVSGTIAHRYRDEYGLDCGVVHNAPPLQDLEVTPVHDPIRIVHSGGAQPNRRIEVMMEAVARSSANATLDLFLTQQQTPYGQSLRELAERLGERVTVHDPVPQAELGATLNRFDVGIHVLPPTNTNNSLALPNKFFDYVQARLALLIGPTEDMVRRLEQFGVGTVSDGFDLDAVVAAVDALTPQRVAEWKRRSGEAAPENCAEVQQLVWNEAVAARVG